MFDLILGVLGFNNFTYEEEYDPDRYEEILDAGPPGAEY